MVCGLAAGTVSPEGSEAAGGELSKNNLEAIRKVLPLKDDCLVLSPAGQGAKSRRIIRRLDWSSDNVFQE